MRGHQSADPTILGPPRARDPKRSGSSLHLFRKISNIDLRKSGCIRRVNNSSFVGAPGRMRMGPLGTVDSIGFHLHPAQAPLSFRSLFRSGSGPILRNGVPRCFPLRALIRASRETHGLFSPGGDVDNLNANVRMVRVAQNLGAGVVGRNVPGIEMGDDMRCSRLQIQTI